MTLNATVGGGAVARDGAIDWAWVPADSTMHLLCPAAPRAEDLASVTRRADEFEASATALWSAVDRDLGWMGDFGFERGWSPWWMAAAPADVPRASGDRVALVDDVRDHDSGRRALAGRTDVVRAEATVGGRYAGRAWLYLDDDVAGIYDMEVWPRFRRRGLGRELLAVLVAEGARRGARIATLNATPEGDKLYAACGFARVGEGRTWWRHRD
jgi:GNAT superfamily N-acetyltransferase